MRICSPDFDKGEQIPRSFTCTGANVNPQLEIKNAPMSTRSFVLVVLEKSESASIEVRWFVVNIPANVTTIYRNSVPDGAVEAISDNSKTYEGPCPIFFNGLHTFIFRVYALDKNLQIPASASYWEVKSLIEKHTIAQAELCGTSEGTAYNTKQSI